jgi:hypothetical protein
MTQYLISFDDGRMTFPDEDLPDVAKAAQAVAQVARDAGVWVFSPGLGSQRASVVATDGTVTDGPYPDDQPPGMDHTAVDHPPAQRHPLQPRNGEVQRWLTLPILQSWKSATAIR